jgi:large subunit ribosomal protein L29
MNSAELKTIDNADLMVRVDKLKEELFGLKVKSATEALQNPARIGQIRRDIARLLTEQSRRRQEAK